MDDFTEVSSSGEVLAMRRIPNADVYVTKGDDVSFLTIKYNYPLSKEKAEAQLCLITAAPDLLAACERALRCFGRKGEPDIMVVTAEDYEQIEAAIAKANKV